MSRSDITRFVFKCDLENFKIHQYAVTCSETGVHFYLLSFYLNGSV